MQSRSGKSSARRRAAIEELLVPGGGPAICRGVSPSKDGGPGYRRSVRALPGLPVSVVLVRLACRAGAGKGGR